MNLTTIILGRSGSGKTFSLRNLGPETVMFTEKTMLPFKNRGTKIVSSDSVSDLLTKLNRLKGNSYPQITNIVINFSEYSDMIMAECKAKYKAGFGAQNAYNTKMYELYQALKSIKKFIFIIATPEFVQFSDFTIVRIPVHGKYHQGRLESLATCIFYSDARAKPNGRVEYLFLSNSDGKFPAKTPMGMFEQMHIENDIAKIVEVYKSFYAQEVPVMNAVVAA